MLKTPILSVVARVLGLDPSINLRQTRIQAQASTTLTETSSKHRFRKVSRWALLKELICGDRTKRKWRTHQVQEISAIHTLHSKPEKVPHSVESTKLFKIQHLDQDHIDLQNLKRKLEQALSATQLEKIRLMLRKRQQQTNQDLVAT